MTGSRIIGVLAALACAWVVVPPVSWASAEATETSTSATSAPTDLSIPSLRLRRVPVLVVGSRGGAIRVPHRSTIGWWRESVPFTDSRGSSLLLGHVSDRRDRPGALYRLSRIRPGAVIRWRQGRTTRHFRVTRLQFTRRTQPLPRRVWSWRGPRTLHLVSCARRVTRADGFHYTHNLTVTARQVRVTRARVGPAH